MRSARAWTLLLASTLGACSAGSAAAPDDAGGSGGPGGSDGSGGAGPAGGSSDGGDAAGIAPAPGADYVVPAGPDTPERRYAIEAPKVKITSDEFRIDYKLPALLVGSDQSVSLRGTLDAQRRIAAVSGDAGTATCDLMPGSGLTLRCDESLTGISVDLDAVDEVARTTDPTHAPSLVAIAKRFASEPIGVLEIR
jgi:hypothetical protein